MNDRTRYLLLLLLAVLPTVVVKAQGTSTFLCGSLYNDHKAARSLVAGTLHTGAEQPTVA